MQTKTLRPVPVLGLALALAPAGGLAAQRWIEPVAHVRTALAGPYFAVTAADLDNDGDQDLLWSGPAADRVQRNLGAGLFADPDPTLLPGSSDTTRLVAFDADRDGDLDLFRARGAEGPQASALYFNDGTGRFTDVTAGRLPQALRIVTDAVAGDVDGDLDQDLVLAGNDGLVLWLNDGSGRFTDVTATHLPAAPVFAGQLALQDLDGDGDLDLTCANTVGLFVNGTLFQNDGTGRFTDVTATRYRSPWSVRATSLALGDLDRDGDPDLILLDAFNLRILANDGSGGFDPDPRLTHPPLPNQATAVQLADVDRDGDLDVFFLYSQSPTVLWRNDGAMRFSDRSAALVPPRSAWTDAGFCDFDGDGDLDLALASRFGRSALMANDGQGQFALATAEPLPEVAGAGQTLAPGDLDGDGDLDLVTGALAWLQNDGKGRFGAQPFGTVQQFQFVTAVAVGDVDGDGDLDVFAGMRQALPPEQPNRIWRNDGSGNLTEAPATLPTPTLTATLDAVFHDLDRDGDPDLLLARAGADGFWRNDGTGTFVDASGVLPQNGGTTTAIRAGDLDRDGDEDVVAAEAGGLRLYLGNPGATQFQDASARLPVLAGVAGVELADVDGDNDLDVVAATAGGVVLLVNDGAGNFGNPSGRIPPNTGACDRLLAADLDLDGDLDLWVARFNAGLRTLLLQNDGSGTFADATSWLPADENPLGLAAFDADADGDPDLCAGSFSRGIKLYLNATRQLTLVLQPRTARPFAIDLHAKPGFAPSATLAGVFVAPREARILVPPFGWLGLDPALLFLLSTPAIPAPGGRLTLVFTLPGDPALVGVTLAAQALMVDAAEARLTNTGVATIR